MRIDALHVANFRGIELATLTDLAQAPLITVSGPNGAGKSLLFEAIALIWRIIPAWERQQIHAARLIGPWGPKCDIEIAVVLSDDELEALAAYSTTVGKPAPADNRAVIAFSLSRDEDVVFAADEWAQPLWSFDFTSTHAFANVDFFPADRSFPRGEHASVNPSLLSDQQRESFRDQIFNSFVQQRQMVNLAGIAPLLASLDYVDLLADREGRDSTGDYDALVNAFGGATSKTLLRPALDPNAPQGSVLRVSTPAGVTHGIDQLSSGEQEVLGLMYFVRRLNARGGVLLIDEPELHLHPSLQRALFAALEATAERAQVWIATHSSRLIAAAPLNAIIHIVPAAGDGASQVTHASDEVDRMRLLEDLGVHPIEALQSDALVVVEGATDVQRLSALLPLELGRTVQLVAGNGVGVETVVKMLNEGEIPVPHLGIRDRDYMSDEEVDALRASIPNLFVWSARSIENEILHPPLIAAMLDRIGREASEDDVRNALKERADRQRDVILSELVEARLGRSHAYEKGGDTPIERQKHHLNEVRRVAEEKLSGFDQTVNEVTEELAERWDTDSLDLADGKRLIAEFVDFTGFRSLHDLLAAITQTAHDHPELLPPGFVELREHLRKVVLPEAPAA